MEPYYKNTAFNMSVVTNDRGNRMTFAEIRRQARSDLGSRLARTRDAMRADLGRIKRMDPATLHVYQEYMRDAVASRRVPGPPPPQWTPGHVASLADLLSTEYRWKRDALPGAIQAAALARASRSYKRLKRRHVGRVRRAARSVFQYFADMRRKGAEYKALKKGYSLQAPSMYRRMGVTPKELAERDAWVRRSRG